MAGKAVACSRPGRVRVAHTLLLALTLLVAGCGRDEGRLGERIYQQGEGVRGRLAFRQGPRWLGDSGAGCAVCHGRRGEGRTVRAGAVVGSAPPLTPVALATRGYDPDGLRRAISEGLDPIGRELDHYMPRWVLSDAELKALLDYLATF